MKIIEIKDLSYKYDEETVLKDINLEINEGEIVSILGHNGSGKSTLSQIIIGLLEGFSGSVKVNGILLSEETVYDVRDNVSIVFQNPDNQFVGTTVRDDIAFGLENKQVSREEMTRLIEHYSKLVGMENFLDKEPHNLSGGQKQRVAIASALALNSKVVILDEATSMLDPEGAKEVLNLIKDLKKLNKTVITITHNLEEARHADRAILLNKGQIVFDGKIDDLFLEEEKLVASSLDILESMKILDLVSKSSVLKENEELKELLCKLSLKM